MNDSHYAIVIGLSSYAGFVDPPADLRGPENDARSVATWLADPAGGALPLDNIKLILSSDFHAPPPDAPWPGHLDQEAFLWVEAKAMESVAAMTGRKVGRRLYIYMSGHGFSPQVRHGCLLTGNAGPGRVTANIGATAWLQWWQEAGYFHEYVMLLDCCMNRMSSAVPTPPPLGPVTVGTPPGPTFVAFAAQRPLRAVELPVPEDGDMVHGVFTWAFLQGLKGAAVNSAGAVTGRSMASWLRNAIYPWLGEPDRNNPEVSREPEIVAEDPALVFARGVAPLAFDVALWFPPDAVGKTARIWSGVPLRSTELVAQALANVALPAGLHVVEVPDAGYRHGFEVVRPTEVAVADRGAPVLPAMAGAPFAVRIDAGDPGNRVSVTAADFEAVDEDSGRIDTRLAWGVYRSRIRAGRQFIDRIFLLDRDVSQTADAGAGATLEVGLESAPALPRVASAVPFSGAPLSHEYQWASVYASIGAQQPEIDVSHGKGAHLMVMARSWSPGGALSDARPWQDVTVVDAGGAVIADLSVHGMRSDEPGRDPFARCLIELAPGTCFLRYRSDCDLLVEQALPAAAGWRLEAYLLRTVSAASESRLQLSLLMRDPALVWEEERDELVEKALVALADERPVLDDELERLLVRKFRNPVEGIIGGHLLLIQSEHDRSVALGDLDIVVRNLRNLVGDEHADVEALSLRCPDESLRRRRPLTTPPLFERSWRLIVAASQQNPALVPLRLWRRVQALAPMPPYLGWSADEAVKEEFFAALARTVQPRPAFPELQDTVELEVVDRLTFSRPGMTSLEARQPRRSGEARSGMQRKEATRRIAETYQLPPSAMRAIRKSGDG